MDQDNSFSEEQDRLSDEEFERIVRELSEKVAQLEALPESFQDRVFSLLRDMDQMHREALLRILDHVRGNAPGIFDDLIRDPAVQILLLLYELSPELESGVEREARDPLIGLEGDDG